MAGVASFVRLAQWRILAFAASALVAVAALKWAEGDAMTSPSRVTVIYVGADDCAPCRTWQQDRWPKFSASPEFARLDYREVKSPTLFDVLSNEHWPEELRLYRDSLGPGAGVPFWFVVADDEVLLKAGGIREWERTVLPKIRSLVR